MDSPVLCGECRGPLEWMAFDPEQPESRATPTSNRKDATDSHPVDHPRWRHTEPTECPRPTPVFVTERTP